MSVTGEQVEKMLNLDEPDYTAAARLGPNALPHLQDIVRHGDPGMAAKAVYLATLIGGDGAMDVISAGAQHVNPVARVAAAAAMRTVSADKLADIGARLLGDQDRGVRHRALSALPASPNPRLRERLGDLADSLPEGEHKRDVLDAVKKARGAT